MAIKFGMSLAEMIAQLTRGFIKATGKEPDSLAKIKIQQEAFKRFKDQKKVVDMEGNVLDPNRPIMGGKQVEEGPIDWDEVNKIDIEDFAGGGIAGMLGEPTYQDEEHRVPYKDAKLVEGENYMPPKNFYGVGLGPILDEFMSEGRPRDEEGFHTTLNKNDLINLWNYLKEDQDIDIEDELMFRFGRFNPDKNSMLHIGIGKDKKEIGFKKKFNEGGRVPYSKGSSPEVLPADFDELDHDELMHIIKLLQAGEIPKLADGGRIGFGAGGIDKMRRLFLQATGAGAAGVGAAKSGLFGLLKSSKSAVVKDLTSVPIKNAEGMPSWFKPLVNRVIKEGTDITKLPPNKGGAYLDRQIVHSAKLGEGQGVKVYQNLDDQTIRVEYHSADNMGGVDDGIVHLEYKAAEEIPMDNEVFKNLPKGKSSVKTKPTFEANEAYPLQDPKDYKTITFEGDNTVKNVDDLFSDTSALKQFGTNKALTKKELAIAKQKRNEVKKINEDPHEEIAGSGPDYDDYDFATGGRVPMWLGGGLTKGKRTLAELLKYMSKGSSHGKTPSEMLYMINPKQFNKMLDRPEGIPSIAKEMIEKYTKEMKIDRTNMMEDLIGTGRKIKKVDDDIAKYKMKIIEDMMSKGTDRATAEQMAETILMMVKQGAGKKATPKITDEGLLEMENIQKNLATKGRKLNATGGLAGMLGE